MPRSILILFPLLLVVLPAASQGKKPVSRPKAPPQKQPAAKTPAKAAPQAAAKPAPKPAAPPARVLRGPLDLVLLQAERRAAVSHSRLVSGSLEDLQDGNRFTHAELAADGRSPAWVQVVLNVPRAVEEVDLTFADEGEREWWLDAANSLADLQRRQGSYRRLVAPRKVTGATADQALVQKAPAFRVYRLEARPTGATATSARLAECALWAPQHLDRMRIETFATDMAVDGRLPLKAAGTFDAGARQNMTPDVRWEITPADAGSVDAFSRFVAAKPGRVELVAVDGPIRSEPLVLEVLPTGKPDWDVTYIERQPRFPLDEETRLTPGQTVRWFAHVKNYGTADADQIPIEWRMDGKTVLRTALPKVERFQQTEAIFSHKWDGKRHKIELVVDPENQVEECSEQNNSLAVLTDALAVGFWVEDSVLRYFHRRQRDLKLGANSWEDWAQRQVASWNEQLLKSAGGVEPAQPWAWRIDRIIVVADGMLPMAGGSPHFDPDRRDTTVNLTYGFPARDLRGPRFRETTLAVPDNPFFRDAGLFQALSRARFLDEPGVVE